MPHQRGRPVPRLPALPGADHRVSPSRRPWCPRGYARVRGVHGPSLLRFAAGEGDRARQRPHRGPGPYRAGARQLHSRGCDDHHSVSRPGDPPSGLRGGAGRYPVPRAGVAPAPADHMSVHVAFSPQGLNPADVQGCAVFVIDILRATTTMCAALHHGAKALIPVASTEEALRLAQTIGSADVLLAGEKNCIRIPGFALGNSPLEMAEPAVRGKTIVVTTTNGTRALLAAQGAAAVYAAGAANLTVAG